MKRKKHFFEIDILKGFAALLVIFIHVLANYKGTSDIHFKVWDMIHFSVGIFVFASGFLQANSTKTVSTWKEAGTDLLKKFKRIIVPYYEYVLLVITAYLITGQLQVFIDKLSPKYIGETLFILSGVGDNWISRLFFFIAIIVILSQLLQTKFKKVLPVLYTICFTWTVYTLFRKINVDFIYWGKFNNIFGWMTIYLTGYYIRKNYEWIKIHMATIIFSIITIASLCYLVYTGKAQGIFSNKYPPTIYFVAYNITASLLTLIIAKTVVNIKKIPKVITIFISWLSKHSYEIFFYHLIFMSTVLKGFKMNVYTDYIVLLTCTLSLVWLISEFKKLIKKKSATIQKLNSKK